MAQREQRRSSNGTPEQRAEIVARVLASGKSIDAMAVELNMSRKTLWGWVERSRMDRIDPERELPVAARKRIRELEQQNARLRRDLEFEKKAGAFFRELDRDENDSL